MTYILTSVRMEVLAYISMFLVRLVQGHDMLSVRTESALCSKKNLNTDLKTKENVLVS